MWSERLHGIIDTAEHMVVAEQGLHAETAQSVDCPNRPKPGECQPGSCVAALRNQPDKNLCRREIDLDHATGFEHDEFCVSLLEYMLKVILESAGVEKRQGSLKCDHLHAGNPLSADA